MKKIITAGILACLLLLCSSTPSLAQLTWGPKPAAVTPRVADMDNGCIKTDWVNCDMYEYNTIAHREFFAAVWDSTCGSTPHANLAIIDYGSIYAAIYQFFYLPIGASHPDVMIGDDITSPCGTAFYVGVVYELTGDIYFEEYLVTNLNSPFYNATKLVSSTRITADPGNHVLSTSPHIDGIPDNSLTCGFTPDSWNQIDKYVITWTEDIGSSNQVWALTENLSNLTPTFSSVQLIGNGERSDVAGTLDVNTGTQTAHFVYVESSGDLYHADWDVSGTMVNTNSIETGQTYLDWPRIEAQNLSNSGASPQAQELWMAVALVSNSPNEVHSFEYNVNTATVSSNNYAGTTGSTGTSARQPVVASGPGIYHPRVGGGGTTCYGDNAFTEGWYVEETSGPAPPAVASTLEGYMAVEVGNDNSKSAPNIIDGYSLISNPNTVSKNGIGGGNKSALALSNCSNTGHEVLAVYQVLPTGVVGTAAGSYAEIQYKVINPLVSPGFQFKHGTTSVLNRPVDGSPNVYPNPAIDILQVSNIKNAGYGITDMMGRKMLGGAVDATHNSINLASLSAGMYFISITEDGKTKTMKFTKE